jgi:hypothetical protein
MAEFLWLGSALGTILGLMHGVYLYRQIAARAPSGRVPGGKVVGLYYALWVLLLWTLFGSYVLAFWILGILAYPIVRLIRGPRTAS